MLVKNSQICCWNTKEGTQKLSPILQLQRKMAWLSLFYSCATVMKLGGKERREYKRRHHIIYYYIVLEYAAAQQRCVKFE